MRKDCIARELTMEVVVGAFVIIILFGLGYFTIILARDTWFGSKEIREALFADVMGLREGDNVVCRGMPVGKVDQLVMERNGVHVQLLLDAPVELYTDCRATIVSTSVLGGHHLLLKQGTPGKGLLPEGRIIDGEQPYDLIADAAEVVNMARKSLQEDRVLENLSSAAASFRNVADRLNRGEGLLGKLINGEDSLYRDLTNTVASIRIVAARVERGESTLGKLLSTDTGLYGDLTNSAASLRRMTDRLDAGRGTLGKLLSEDETIYTDLKETSGALRRVVERVDRGEGSLGRILTDDTLYNDLQATVGEVRGAVDDFRDTAPVATFTSIFFGAF